MVVRFGLIVRIVQANFTYLGEQLFGDCEKYYIELIANVLTLLIIVCLLIIVSLGSIGVSVMDSVVL